MPTLSRWFFWGYTLMLLGVGVSGVFIASWELRVVFSVPMDHMNDAARATLLNQYRFLKSLELGFGIFCIAYRRRIFLRSLAHKVFLAGVFAGVAARMGGWLADGRPSPVFIAFAVLELATGLLVWHTVRGTVGVVK
ncbi:DUF4345 domain-containing protein [Paralcaligenes sp. KSB-10]|jgi:hypothetical protein|uniref:DUF4345 family protein n=1 Tax=Paralcaligenes sp. KSB-10 TaxID=2901142 RepID=UPI001E36A349|nr:DUF4345 family protein [Paralcaligenes sp. KSB-10]UHL62980.1 DUF4345 domain-containing protein [Paralcaligenes sp. KSB-10]